MSCRSQLFQMMFSQRTAQRMVFILTGTEFEIVAAGAAVILLLWAAIQDLKTREVDDLVWILMLALGIPFTGIRILLYGDDTTRLILMVLSIFAGFTLAFIILFSGLQGGADAKALFCTSLVCPFPLTIPEVVPDKLIPFSITVFMNSLLLLIPFPLVIFFYNLIHRKEFTTASTGSRWSHFLALFLGYPAALEAIKKKHPWHYDFIEQRNEDDWSFNFRVTLGDPEEDLARRKKIIELAEKDGRDFLWIQPGVPFLVAFLVAFLISFLWGNLYFIILKHLFPL
jgi:prepilin signal peptidase PulO-like enzyme (type II secretory pathway)